MILIFIGLGGALGSISRYLLGKLVSVKTGVTFPIGTLLINTSGAFVLNFLLQWSGSAALAPYLLQAVTVGFLGAYTTFSTFSYETFKLVQDNEYFPAMAYVLATILLGMLAAWVGKMAAAVL